MNEYEVFEQLRKLLGLSKVQSKQSRVVKYQKFVQTGKFKALSDYGEGFLVISFYMIPSATIGRYQVRFCVSTIDDGSWGGLGLTICHLKRRRNAATSSQRRSRIW